MNKIISKLLSVQFPAVDLESLMEIVNATRNPELATEILCGLYEEPIFPEMVILERRHNDAILKMTSYDKWNDKVHYSYQREKTISARVAESTDASIVTKDNYKDYLVSNSPEYKYISVKTGEMETATDYVNSSAWLSSKIVTIEDLKNELDLNAFESEHC